jgi:hypothetical protein
VIIKLILSLLIGLIISFSLKISLIKGLFCSIILCGILVFTPGLNDTTNELIKPITEKMVDYITENESLSGIFSNESFLSIFSGII